MITTKETTQGKRNFPKNISEIKIFQSQVRKYFKTIISDEKGNNKNENIRNGSGKLRSKKKFKEKEFP